MTFLYDNKAIEMVSYINSSIYFKLKVPYSMAVIKKLSKDFESYITLIEKEFGGKIFWTFNYLVKFTPKDKPQQIGIVGQANKTFYEKFNDKLILLINILILRKNP